MAITVQALRERYIDACSRHDVLPSQDILAALQEAETSKENDELCYIHIYLDHLKDIDFEPLLDICMQLDDSVIDVVDMTNDSPLWLKDEYALALMRAIDKKLRAADFRNCLFGKNFLRDLSQRGLPCQILQLFDSSIRKLNMTGNFMQLNTLVLDFSCTLTSFHEDCFSCMPNLMRLSMCETEISNLWTTTAALSKLPSLLELRFQVWLCCNDAGSFSASSSLKSQNETDSSEQTGGVSVNLQEGLDQETEELGSEDQSMSDNSSDDLNFECWNLTREYGPAEKLSNVFYRLDGKVVLLNEDSFDTSNQNEEGSTVGAFTKQDADISHLLMSRHPSPICSEKHYREFIIASLPRLIVLDGLSIRKTDKERAIITYSEHFEHFPYKRKSNESIVSILQKREKKSDCRSGKNSSCPSWNSQNYYTKSLCAAKMGSSSWPLLHPLPILITNSGGQSRSLRPRQFEYHPTDSSLMVIGTLDGEVAVVNHETVTVTSYIPSSGAMHSVMGLCWLNKHPSMLIAGSDNSSLKLFDIQHFPPSMSGMYSGSDTFDKFDQLTSVHVNSSDELFLTSGYTREVALYDIGSGRLLKLFNNMHQQHINFVKFANHSPAIFATSSFDRDVKVWDLRQKPLRPCYTISSPRGNVMVCFSPDDHYLLVSAFDNEVRQHLAVDGRFHLDFAIAPTGSYQNYTRSYYMNGQDYIISGSSEEHVVRICCAQTGRRLRDIAFEQKHSGTSMYVKSLRGDPFREFNMSILAANSRTMKTDIVKHPIRRRQSRPNNSVGG
ncbi:hypothetical protein UlMin_031083 [Ulmus minor]